jgi:hypothetical protein
MSIRAFNPLPWRRSAVVALCLAAVLGGCTDKSTPTWSLPSPFLPRTSPANLLHNLKMAYEKRDLAEYDSLLAKDFTFVLSAEDQGKPGMPDSWWRDQEIQIHTHLLDAGMVRTLTVDFGVADSVWDPAGEMYTVLISNVNLYLVGATPAHPGDVKEYRVTNGRSKFWFRKNGWTVPGKPDSVWTIVKWEDSPIDGMAARGSALVDPQTWGLLKALFR